MEIQCNTKEAIQFKSAEHGFYDLDRIKDLTNDKLESLDELM